MVVVDLDDAEVKMDRETNEIDLPQNSDCSKLGDQNNKMDEEEESEVLMRIKTPMQQNEKGPPWSIDFL
ncbi:hypothetical protein BY996DRAFT_6476478 [Phakopsora pachyrhizi]|nr:hypothetical protein BY996DRAFT_6476478 [Phakopsora pachyrhizi]